MVRDNYQVELIIDIIGKIKAGDCYQSKKTINQALTSAVIRTVGQVKKVKITSGMTISTE